MEKIKMKVNIRWVTYGYLIFILIILFQYFSNKYSPIKTVVNTIKVNHSKVTAIEHKFKIKKDTKYVPIAFYYERLPDGSYKLNTDLSSYPKDWLYNSNVVTYRKVDLLSFINIGLTYNIKPYVGIHATVYKNLFLGTGTDFDNIYLATGWGIRNLDIGVGYNFDKKFTAFISTSL